MKKRNFEIIDYNGAGIYAIINTETNRAYIGSSYNVNDRLKRHNRSFNNEDCNGKILPDLLNGAKFRSEILEMCEPDIPEKELRNKEDNYIKNYPHTYNFTECHRPTCSNRHKIIPIQH